MITIALGSSKILSMHFILQTVEEAFLHAVSETLTGHYPRHLEVLYRRVIKYIINLLVAGFKSALDESNKIPITNALPQHQHQTILNCKD